jgi:hypothetical protein
MAESLQSEAADRPPGTGRMESFSDGVIAILITIMVLEPKLPADLFPGGHLADILRASIAICPSVAFDADGATWLQRRAFLMCLHAFLSKARPAERRPRKESPAKEVPMHRNSYRQKVWLALGAILLAAGTPAKALDDGVDRYVRCSFYPQGKGWDQAYQQALHDVNPAAASVRDAFEHYARYLKPDTSGLTDNDKRYLVQNEIRTPFDLSAANLAGLHNVVNDPSLAGDPTARRLAVNGFIARAVQAELYCGTSGCQDDDSPPSS